VDLDRKFANEYRGAAVDIDIFANNVQTSTDAEQMEVLEPGSHVFASPPPTPRGRRVIRRAHQEINEGKIIGENTE
jgi:hypothetical protein